MTPVAERKVKIQERRKERIDALTNKNEARLPIVIL
jgi:hypothetical protein